MPIIQAFANMTGNTHAVTGLIEKRRDLSGRIEHYKDEIKALKIDLAAIDSALKIFDPEFDIRTIKPKEIRKINRWFYKGESTKLLMDILREADKPLSTTEIVDLAAAHKGYSFDDVDRKSFTSSIFTTLKRFEEKGIAKQLGREYNTAMWRTAD